MAKTPGWSKVVHPFLTDKLNQSFPDPTLAKDEREFVYQAMTASVFKKVIAELLGWVDANIEQAKALEAKQRGEIKEKRLGGD